LHGLLDQHGVLSIAERVPRHTQRLYRLLDLTALESDLARRLVAVEESIYTQADDPLVNWDAEDHVQLFTDAGFAVEHTVEEEHMPMQVTAGVIERWFAPATGERPSYGERLAQQLSADELMAVRTLFERQLLNQTVQWSGRIGYFVATPLHRRTKK
jgi:putative ATPase